jgi:putative hydrolase of HD superfamily
MEDLELQKIIQSCFEARYLKRIQRSGNSVFLWNDVSENVVEHSFYVALFGLIYSQIEWDIDWWKLLTMCIIHDLVEVRCGDYNQVNVLYGSTNELKAFSDMRTWTIVGENLTQIFEEIQQGVSKEALAFKDCDGLAQMLAEKEYITNGKVEAQERIERTQQRIKTSLGKKLSDYIISWRMSARREEIKNNIRTSKWFPAKDYNEN